MNPKGKARERRLYMLRLVLDGMTPAAAYRAMGLEPSGGTFHRDLKALVDTKAVVRYAPEHYAPGPGVGAWDTAASPVVVPKNPFPPPDTMEGQGIRKAMDLGPKFGLERVAALAKRTHWDERKGLVAPMTTAAGPGERPGWLPASVPWRSSTSYTFVFLLQVRGIDKPVKVQVTGKNRWKAQYYLPPVVYHGPTALEERNAWVKKGVDVAREIIRHVLEGHGTLDGFDPMDISHEEIEHPIPADQVAPGWSLRDPDGNTVYTDATLKVLGGPGLNALGTRGDLANFVHLAGPYAAATQSLQAARENRRVLFALSDRLEAVQGDMGDLTEVVHDLAKATGNLAKAVNPPVQDPDPKGKDEPEDPQAGGMYG